VYASHRDGQWPEGCRQKASEWLSGIATTPVGFQTQTFDHDSHARSVIVVTQDAGHDGNLVLCDPVVSRALTAVLLADEYSLEPRRG